MFQAAPHKSIQFVGDTPVEVAKEIVVVAEEAVDNVYGSVVRRLNEKGEVLRRYDIHITVRLEPK